MNKNDKRLSHAAHAVKLFLISTLLGFNCAVFMGEPDAVRLGAALTLLFYFHKFLAHTKELLINRVTRGNPRRQRANRMQSGCAVSVSHPPQSSASNWICRIIPISIKVFLLFRRDGFADGRKGYWKL